MENLEIEIQDKNQLALFSLLSRDQEINKARTLKMFSDRLELVLTQNANKLKFLLDNGFQEGIDFTSNFKVVVVTNKINVGNFRESHFIDVEYKEVKGDIYLIYDKYNSYGNEICLQSSTFSLEKGKMNCHGLQNYSSRMINPKTMLEKIKEANIIAERQFITANKKKSILDYTVEKYTNLFPKAIVTKSTDSIIGYRNHYDSFDVVHIKFENGSYLKLRLGYENDKEYIHKKYDAVEFKETVLGVLNLFNLQNI